MTEAELQTYYDKFPIVLKERLKRKQLCFPKDIEFFYKPIEAYRMVIRAKDDSHPFDLEDMRSYHEQGKLPRGVQKMDEANPLYYAVSLFENIEGLKQSLKFPNPKKKVAHGYVYEEGGPCLRSASGHISWWLFEGVDLSGFEILEE